MSDQRRDETGRFTAGGTELPDDKEDREDEFSAALDEAYEDRRTQQKGWGWSDETPLPPIKEEFAQLSEDELEATVVAARKRNGYIEELAELEERIKGTSRKLTFDVEHGDKETAPKYRGNLTEIEDMLGAFGQDDLDVDGLDALGRLQAVVSVVALQPKLNVLMGRKEPIGTLDKLVDEVVKLYPDEVSVFKAGSKIGGSEMLSVVKIFMRTVMVGTGMRRALMAMVVTRIWSKDEKQRYSRAVRDMVQVLCRLDSSEWEKVKEEGKRGEMRQDLLTDEPVADSPGYKRLLPVESKTDEDRKLLDACWIDVVVATANLLGYEPTEVDDVKSILRDWRITYSSHKDCQKSGVNVREMMTDLRESLAVCRRRLRRIGKEHRGPDAEEIVENLMLAPLPSIKMQIRDKMRLLRLKKKDVTVEVAVKLLVQAEEELGIDSYSFESAAGAPKGTGSLGGAKPNAGGLVNSNGGQRRQNAGDGSDLDKARIVYARKKGMMTKDVTPDMIKANGGIEKWAKDFVLGGDSKKAGVHVVGTQKEQYSQAEERKKSGHQTVPSGKMVDSVELPKPGAPMPAMGFQVAGGGGWKKVRFADGAKPEAFWMAKGEKRTGLEEAVDAYRQKTVKGQGFDKWREAIRETRRLVAENALKAVMDTWQAPPVQTFLETGLQDQTNVSTDSPVSSAHTSTSPRMGSRRRMCKCCTGHGSHGCRVELEEGDEEYCSDCAIRGGGGLRDCQCDCDQCENFIGPEEFGLLSVDEQEEGCDGEEASDLPDLDLSLARAFDRPRRPVERNHSHEAPEGSDGFELIPDKDKKVPKAKRLGARWDFMHGRRIFSMVEDGIHVRVESWRGHALSFRSAPCEPWSRYGSSKGGSADDSMNGGAASVSSMESEAVRLKTESMNGGAAGGSSIEFGTGPESLNGGAAGMQPMGSVESREELKPALGHVGFIGEKAIGIGWDTFCEPNAIRDTLLDPTCEVKDESGLEVVGVGAARLGKRVLVPVRFRYSAETEMVEARVTKGSMMPSGCDFLCGTRMQKEYGVVLDARQERLEIWKRGVSIVQEELWVIRARMDGVPLKVLDLCAGISGAYSVFRDQGWNIEQWHSVEADGLANRVAEVLYGGRVQLMEERVENFTCSSAYDVVLAGPPCQPWSRLNDRASGFEDPRSLVFIHCCRIVNEAMECNSLLKFMLENVVIKEELRDDAFKQSEFLGWSFEELNASWCGAQSSRLRRIAQNVVSSVSDLEGRTPTDPNLSLNCLGSSMEKRLAGCVVASGANSKAAIKVMDIAVGQERNACLDEMEALMGQTVGSSDAHGMIHMEYEQRAALIGNGFHYEMVRAIFAEMEPVQVKQVVTMMPMRGEQEKDLQNPPVITEQESLLSGMSREELKIELKDRLGDYEMARLHLKLAAENTVPYQANPRGRYQTPKG